MSISFARRVFTLGLVGALSLPFVACKKSSSSSAAASSPTYSVGGTITGLVGTVVLQNMGGDDLSVSASGTFTFSKKLAANASYAVTVVTDPTGQDCVVTDPTGTVGSADVNTVSIACSFEVVAGCDSGLTLASNDAADAAKAMGICTGLSSAGWELPDGTTNSTSPVASISGNANFHLGHGILSGFGTNVSTREGLNLLAISTGTARRPIDPGYVAPTGVGQSKGFQNGLTGLTGFPSTGDGGGGCTAPSSVAYDGIALRLNLTVPAGANAFTYDYKYYASDFSQYVCTQYADQAAGIVTTPFIAFANSLATNLFNDQNMNSEDILVCDSASHIGYPCTLGSSELTGTGFETKGATGWMTSSVVEVEPGDSVTLRLMVWDSGDGSGDSTLLVDNFRWFSE